MVARVFLPTRPSVNTAVHEPVAKNCRTSVGMIEKYYGVHIKNSLDAAAINVVRSKKDWQEEEA